MTRVSLVLRDAGPSSPQICKHAGLTPLLRPEPLTIHAGPLRRSPSLCRLCIHTALADLRQFRIRRFFFLQRLLQQCRSFI
jgi:hypothetical protein